MQEATDKPKGDWIMLHRKIQDNPVFNDAVALRIFLKCLLKANFKGKEFEHVYLKRGEFAFSYRNLSEELNVAPNTLRSVLKKLSRWGCLRVKNAKKFSVVTVVNYDTYQAVVSTDDTPTDTVIDTPTDTRVEHNRRKIITQEQREQGGGEPEGNKLGYDPNANPYDPLNGFTPDQERMHGRIHDSLCKTLGVEPWEQFFIDHATTCVLNLETRDFTRKMLANIRDGTPERPAALFRAKLREFSNRREAKR